MGQVAARSIVWLLFGVALLTPACRDRALPIPNSVSDEEYSLYSAWVKHHFKEQPPRLLLASRTFILDPLGPHGLCNAKLLESRGHVSSSLLRALHDLGEAEYLVDTRKFKLPAFRIPWKYEDSESLYTNPSPGYSLIEFSRVAFNRDRSEAFLQSAIRAAACAVVAVRYLGFTNWASGCSGLILAASGYTNGPAILRLHP